MVSREGREPLPAKDHLPERGEKQWGGGGNDSFLHFLIKSGLRWFYRA